MTKTKHKEKQELCLALWTECRDELTKLCRFKLNSCPDEIDEVISETFYCLCKAVFEDKKIDNPKAWLFAATSNLIKKKYTQINKIKNNFVSLDEGKIELDKGEYYIDDVLLYDSRISDEIIETLSVEIIEKLNDSERQLYKYIYEDRLKMKEVADIMGISTSAVKQRHYRLSKVIKRIVRDCIERL